MFTAILMSLALFEPRPTSTAGETAKVKAAIACLSDEDFDTREAAFKELIAAGEAAMPSLLVNSEHKDPEVAQRCALLVDRHLGIDRRGYGPLVCLAGPPVFWENVMNNISRLEYPDNAARKLSHHYGEKVQNRPGFEMTGIYDRTLQGEAMRMFLIDLYQAGYSRRAIQNINGTAVQRSKEEDERMGNNGPGCQPAPPANP